MDFQFSYDEELRLMTVIQNGYWSMATFRAFEAELLDWHKRISAIQQECRILAECEGFKVQSSEIGEAFGILFARFMNEFRGRYAVIVGSMMNKLQAARLLPYPHLRVFTGEERERAMAWLLGQDAGRQGEALN